MKQLLIELSTWAVALYAAHTYPARHRKKRSESEYHKPGATHYGNWYDEDTKLWPLVTAS